MPFGTRKKWLPLPDSFWGDVNKNGPQIPYVEGVCWLWRRYTNPSGYGMVRIAQKRVLFIVAPSARKEYASLIASRVSWELTFGAIPAELLVLHRCDNRRCVRPSHLFLGDTQANVDDMYAKKRGHKSHGERQHLAKLTEADVREIRAERAKTPPTMLKVLAPRYGVSMHVISLCASRKTWKHVS